MHTRKEAENLGIPLSPTKNEKNRRAPWHDYRLPGLYMLTMVTLDRRRLLGNLITDPYPCIDLTPLGQTILCEEIGKMHEFYPNVKVWKSCLMPDHMHIIVEVCESFPDNKTLGNVVSGFKAGCNKAYRRIYGLERGSMFNPHYNDSIILPGMQYERWKHYLEDNPRRLAIKHLYPEYFTTRYASTVCGVNCQSFGNLFLLNIPDKMEVIVHRRDSDETFRDNFNKFMACGERGGVLVSAAIAPREKEVINEAKARGYKVIELRDNGFGPYHKPCGADFDNCAAGLLLQISPWEYNAQHIKITREKCLLLNSLAASIVMDM